MSTANPAPLVPTSTDLQDLLTRVVETADTARDASARRDAAEQHPSYTEGTYHRAHRDAMDANAACGAALEDMRSAIRRAATVLDHAAPSGQTNAGLLRQIRDLNDRVQRLISERDGLRAVVEMYRDVSVQSASDAEAV